MSQFLCDVCYFEYFEPLSKLSAVEVKGDLQLTKQQGTGTYWKCARCGTIYSQILEKDKITYIKEKEGGNE